MAEKKFWKEVSEFDGRMAARSKSPEHSGLSKSEKHISLPALAVGLFACGNLETGEGMNTIVVAAGIVGAAAGLSDGKHTMGYYAVKTAHLKMRALKDVAQEAFKNLGKRVSQTLEQAKAKAAARRSEGIELVVKRPGEKEYILDQKGSNFVRKPATNPLAMMKQGRQGR